MYLRSVPWRRCGWLPPLPLSRVKYLMSSSCTSNRTPPLPRSLPGRSMPCKFPLPLSCRWRWRGNVTMIAGLLNQMIFSFHAQKEIKSAEQLRGKIVGADRIGTPNDYGVRTALTKLGLKPESDVQLLRLGGSAIQWSALQSKQIAASALTPPVSFKADAQGFTRLAETYDLPYQNIGLVIRK